MNKTFKTIMLSGICAFALVACNSETASKTIEEETVVVEEENSLGKHAGIVGKWHVDAATAGVELSLGFTAEGEFSQKMGDIVANGNWEVIDDDYIEIVSNLTEGQKVKVSNLTAKTATFTWYPSSGEGEGKDIIMTRVQ